MILPPRAAIRHRRAGFTVTEMVISTGLATLLMMLLATTWATFGRPALEVEARARIEQEGILAAQSLACDFGGFLADAPNRTWTMSGSTPNPYRPVTNPPWDSSHFPELWLNFYGTNTSEVIAIRYWIQGTQLLRTSTNLSTGASTTTTVASYVTENGFAASLYNTNQVKITITIGYPIRNPKFTSTFILIGVAPPS